ncbi:hypothetical protein JOB18_006867 [Solea senegalensis]|uniref:Uncharacterized protein n=1 Tax=Solea senegalensis TaxID=28829 RepID=A0AAV6RAS0_SOLSE|nr:hypothetical protein JOB18_006867 [Solea senegalensis]
MDPKDERLKFFLSRQKCEGRTFVDLEDNEGDTHTHTGTRKKTQSATQSETLIAVHDASSWTQVLGHGRVGGDAGRACERCPEQSRQLCGVLFTQKQILFLVPILSPESCVFIKQRSSRSDFCPTFERKHFHTEVHSVTAARTVTRQRRLPPSTLTFLLISRVVLGTRGTFLHLDRDPVETTAAETLGFFTPPLTTASRARTYVCDDRGGL